MVYSIRPDASPLDFSVELEFEIPPSAFGANVRDEEFPRDAFPKWLKSQRTRELPDAFVPCNPYWCVSSTVRAFFWSHFGDQLVFYETPVTSIPLKAPLQPTYFVAFRSFRTEIDWDKSKIVQRPPSFANQPFVSFGVGSWLPNLVFRPQPESMLIWREKSVRTENKLFHPPDAVFVTNEAADLIDSAFPELFDMDEIREE